MANLAKLLPGCGFVIAVTLVGITSAFKDAPKGQQTQFWVLKSGTTASTNPADYEEGAGGCDNQIHFCGFFSSENGSTGQPLIPSGSALQSDLSTLHTNPNSQVNTSGDIRFLDAD